MVLLVCVVILVLVLVAIICVVIFCVVKQKSNPGQNKGKRPDKPQSTRTSVQNGGDSVTGPGYPNAPSDNEEPGVEYAEINMHLLAPKPEKQDAESDNEAAPLVYADLAFHDNKDAISNIA